MANNTVLHKGKSNIPNGCYTIALAGNPNTGKSTLFNALTGLHQHTGNWPGKTVARAEGSFEYKGKQYKIVDLPGTYSLLSTSEDEEVARNFILFGQPALTIIIADATRLERNLNLVLQILGITANAILVVNLLDEAARNSITIELNKLSERLHIPVVGTSAREGKGIPELLETIHKVVTGELPPATPPHKLANISGEVAQALQEITTKLKAIYPQLPNAEWVAMRLLDGDSRMQLAVTKNQWDPYDEK